MMKIAVITPGFMPVPDVIGGAVEALCTYIIDENEIYQKLDIDMFTVYNSLIDLQKYRKSNIFQYKRTIFDKICDHTNILFNKKTNRDYYSFCIKKIKQNIEKYDYIILENNIDIAFRMIQEGETGILGKLIYHIHNDIGTLEYSVEKIQKLCDYNVPIIAVSKYIMNHINECCDNSNVFLLKNVIDFEQFSNTSVNKDALREELGIPKNNIVFIFAGRFVEYKGLLELINAFNKACEKYNNICLLVAGSLNGLNDSEDEYCLKLKKASEGNGHIKFLGYVEHKNLFRYYQISDVTVVPSLWAEPASLVQLEGQAAHCAVIATNRGGISEYQGENTCMFVDDTVGVVEGLNKAICGLVENSGMLEQLKIEGYKNAEKYSKTKYYQEMISLIKDNI